MALSTLGQEPGLRDEMGRAGRRRVQEHFELRAQLDRVEKMYRDVIADARAQPTPSQP